MAGAPRTPAGSLAGAADFFVYWRSQRWQFFSFRARVTAWTAREARQRFHPPRGPQPRIVGVKRCGTGNACAAAGRWVG